MVGCQSSCLDQNMSNSPVLQQSFTVSACPVIYVMFLMHYCSSVSFTSVTLSALSCDFDLFSVAPGKNLSKTSCKRLQKLLPKRKLKTSLSNITRVVTKRPTGN